jgi:hypothetical protein
MNAFVRDRLVDERKRFEPNVITLVVDDRSAPQLSKLVPFLNSLEFKGLPTLYRCVDFTCSLPEVVEA